MSDDKDEFNGQFIRKYLDQYSLSTIELNCPFNIQRRDILSNESDLMSILLDCGISFHESKIVVSLLNGCDPHKFTSPNQETKSFAIAVENILKDLTNSNHFDLFMTLLLRLFENVPPAIRIYNQSQYKNIMEVLFDRLCHSSDYTLILSYCIIIKLLSFNPFGLESIQFDSLMMSSKVLLHIVSESNLIIIKTIKHLFRIRKYHQILFEFKIVLGLLPFCEQTNEVETSYNALFCIWCFSCHPENIPRLYQIRVQFIHILSNIIHSYKKEKILRMTLYILKNITNFSEYKMMSKTFISFMAHDGVHEALQLIIKGKFIKDEELMEIMVSINKKILQVLSELSSFEQYQIELSSGHLRNTMMHSNEQFWKNNITKFVGKSEEIQKLIAYLNISKDNKSINLALEDINLYLKHHPFGKINLVDLGVKKNLYELLNHSDTLIKMKALSMLQKLFIK